MTLKVVGTGFGRTGTNSLKLALELLGFGPCHHMYEVRDHPQQVPFWQRAAAGESVDWEEVFVDYQSCVDWPSVRYWREITGRYPNAKVIHSVRDPDSWISSVHKTIFPAMQAWSSLESGVRRERTAMAYEIVVNQTFAGRLHDRQFAKSVYLRHTEEVCTAIDADRLLVYEVGSGWEPLCQFLNVDVPSAPYPQVNSIDDFKDRRLDA